MKIIFNLMNAEGSETYCRCEWPTLPRIGDDIRVRDEAGRDWLNVRVVKVLFNALAESTGATLEHATVFVCRSPT